MHARRARDALSARLSLSYHLFRINAFLCAQQPHIRRRRERQRWEERRRVGILRGTVPSFSLFLYSYHETRPSQAVPAPAPLGTALLAYTHTSPIRASGTLRSSNGATPFFFIVLGLGKAALGRGGGVAGRASCGRLRCWRECKFLFFLRCGLQRILASTTC